jgi:pimeloyl-ACP methyl ester carboxylesterase
MVQVWVLDALPGAARESAQAEQQHRQDHPADLIPALRAVQLPLSSRAALQQHLLAAGFSCKVAAWIASSLRPTDGDARCHAHSRSHDQKPAAACLPRCHASARKSGHHVHVALEWCCRMIVSCDVRRQLQWSFNVEGVSEMYASFEEASFWPFLSAPTQGIRVDFVRAQHSSYLWCSADLERLRAYGHRVHLLPHAGHWLHADNPDGLMTILSPSFT